MKSAACWPARTRPSAWKPSGTAWTNNSANLFGRLESEPFGAELLARDETREIVGATMSQLPPHYREALEAKYVNGQSVQQMAADRGLSEKAVESQLTRARKAFRAMFLALARNLNVEPLP